MTTEITTVEQLQEIIREAREAAYGTAKRYFDKNLGGVDQYACGFAWTTITAHNGVRITGRTKMGRLLKKAGITQDWNRLFQIWNPSGMAVQNVDTLLAGAIAAAHVLTKYGFEAYGASRLD